eukprot:SAG11_NODE_38286_length_253_cov_0.636364_1_plen_64_part_10
MNPIELVLSRVLFNSSYWAKRAKGLQQLANKDLRSTRSTLFLQADASSGSSPCNARVPDNDDGS